MSGLLGFLKSIGKLSTGKGEARQKKKSKYIAEQMTNTASTEYTEGGMKIWYPQAPETAGRNTYNVDKWHQFIKRVAKRRARNRAEAETKRMHKRLGYGYV